MGPLKRESQLQQLIGRKAVKALVSVFPGRRISVPGSSPEHIRVFWENFAPLIGEEEANLLLENFGGERITVPTHRPRVCNVDIARVAELTIQNLTAQQIAALLKCEPRSVHKARTTARRHGLLPKHPGKRKVRA